jgi:glycosyltransferase involved in cell wall biosynthesis
LKSLSHAKATAATEVATGQRPIRLAIVHYRDDAAAGGSLRVGETLANHLDPKRVETHLVFAYGGPGPVTERTLAPAHFLRSKGPTDFAAWRYARRLFADLCPDIIHYMDPVVWLNLALSRTPYIKIIHVHFNPVILLEERVEDLMSIIKMIHVHGKPVFSHTPKWYQRLLYRAIGRTADATICITDGARQSVLRLGWARFDRCWTVYNAVDNCSFTKMPSRDEARRLLRLPRDTHVLGMVCRLVGNKGCLEALALLCHLPDDWHLALCGDGPLRQELETRSKSSGLGGRVHFLGLLHDVRPMYAAIDAYLFLSHYESFGLVLAEAMAANVPIFGLGGGGEYREPEYPLVTSDNAIFFNREQPGDNVPFEQSLVLRQLAAAIEKYGDNPETSDEMARRARRWVQQKFDAGLQAQQVSSLYREILQTTRQ